MKRILVSLLFAIAMSATLNANAASINVSVAGTAEPWDPSINLAYTWTPISGVTAPTVVDSSDGFAMNPGDTLTVTYLSGLITDYSISGVDANGDTSWLYDSYGSPGYYLPPAPANLDELMGAFTNNGVVVGNPFFIGNGPTNLILPNGADQLSLGVNDNIDSDNGGAVLVNVSGPSPIPTPEPTSIILGLMSMGGLLGFKKRK